MTETILELVKTRLGRQKNNILDEYLTSRIAAAIEQFDRKGIHIQDTPGDCMFVCDYVAWEYSNRDKGDGQPEWLRTMIRERFLTEGTGV